MKTKNLLVFGALIVLSGCVTSQIPNQKGSGSMEIVSATYGENLELHTRTEEWRGKVFIQSHRIKRNDTLICEGRATRALCIKQQDGRLKAVEVPEFIRAACD